MTTGFGKAVEHLSVWVIWCPSFPFGFEGVMLVLIVLIPDHCLSVYFVIQPAT